MRPNPNPSPPLEDEDDDAPEGGRRSDPELLTMASILRTLQKLDGPARARVVRWLGDRFAAEL